MQRLRPILWVLLYCFLGAGLAEADEQSFLARRAQVKPQLKAVWGKWWKEKDDAARLRLIAEDTKKSPALLEYFPDAVYSSVGKSYKRLGQYEEAAEAFEKGATSSNLFRHFGPFLFQMAWNRWHQGSVLRKGRQGKKSLRASDLALMVVDVVPKYDKAPSKFRNEGVGWSALASKEEILWGELIQLGEELIPLGPCDTCPLAGVAYQVEGYARTKQYEKAIQAYQANEDSSTQNRLYGMWSAKMMRSTYYAGVAYLELGRHEEARECFKFCVDLHRQPFKAWGMADLAEDSARKLREIQRITGGRTE